MECVLLKRPEYFFGLVILFPLLTFLFGSVNNYNQINSLAIGQNSLFTEVNKSVYVDESNSLLEDSVMEAQFSQFSDTINWGFSANQYFYRYEIKNKSNVKKDYVLFMDNPMMDSIRVYEVLDKKPILIEKLGDTASLNNPSKSAIPKISFYIEPNDSKSFLIATNTTGSAFLPMILFERTDYERYKTAILLIWGAFIGIACVMTVYNLVLYFGSKDNLYLFYIGYVVFFTLELGVLHGFAAFLVPETLYHLLSKNINVLNAIISFFTLRFAVRFLKYENLNRSTLVRCVKLFSFILLAFALVFIFLSESNAAVIFFFLQLITYGLVISLMVSRFKERLRWTKFYIISWLPLFAGAAVGSLMFMGVLQYEFWTRHAALIGVMLEMSLISLALAERLRISEQERLFQASHHPTLGIANSTIIVNSINNYIQNNKSTHDLTLVSIDIKKYHSITPYLNEVQLKKLVFSFIEEIKDLATLNLLLLELEAVAKFKNFAIVREGTIAFLVLSNDDALLKKTLNSIAEYSPINCRIDGVPFYLPYTVGVASFKDCNNEPNSLINNSIRAADIAAGVKDKIHFYIPDSSKKVVNKLHVASELKSALEFKRFNVSYNIITDKSSNNVIGINPILELKSEIYGCLLPFEYIHIAEDSGLASHLVLYNFEVCCELVNQLAQAPTFISFVISETAFQTSNLVNDLLNTCNEYGVSPQAFLINLNMIPQTYLQKKLVNELAKAGFQFNLCRLKGDIDGLFSLPNFKFDYLEIESQLLEKNKQDKDIPWIIDLYVKILSRLNCNLIVNASTTKFIPVTLNKDYLIKSPCKALTIHQLDRLMEKGSIKSGTSYEN